MTFDLIAVDDPDGRRAFEQKLAENIENMLRNDFAGLMQALYRVDVAESVAAQAFAAPTLAETAIRLARAVVERQLQKIETRKKYAAARANRFSEPNESPPDDATNSPS